MSNTLNQLEQMIGTEALILLDAVDHDMQLHANTLRIYTITGAGDDKHFIELFDSSVQNAQLRGVQMHNLIYAIETKTWSYGTHRSWTGYRDWMANLAIDRSYAEDAVFDGVVMKAGPAWYADYIKEHYV